MKTVLLIRDFGFPTGGHLKVFHYMKYMLGSGLVRPLVYLTPSSLRDQSNFFLRYPEIVVDRITDYDLLFLGGVDWPTADALGLLRPEREIIAILQSVRHANPDDPYRPYCLHRATRIFGSHEVADAIRSLGPPNGPAHVIQSAFPCLGHIRLDPTRRSIDVFVDGFKNAALAERIGSELTASGVTTDVLTQYATSGEYHRRMAQAQVVIIVTFSQEGSSLPALAAMGLDVAVVCPDTPGIHDYCRAGETALLTERDPSALAEAARHLLADAGLCARLRANGRKIAEYYTLEWERARFLPILAQALET
jgi:glycosyltransferase involved in cell wall biosynthesis